MTATNQNHYLSITSNCSSRNWPKLKALTWFLLIIFLLPTEGSAQLNHLARAGGGGGRHAVQLVNDLFINRKSKPQSRFRGGVASAADVPPPNNGIKDLSYDAEESKCKNSDQSYIERVVRTQWSRHRQWRHVHRVREKDLLFSRRLHLGLMIAGATLQTLSTQVPKPYGWVCSLGGAACVGAAPISERCFSDDNYKKMCQALAVSLGIKAEVYKFRAGIEPYNMNNPKEAAAILMERGRALSKSAKDSKLVFAHYDGKPFPPELDADGYLEHRVENRHRFYQSKAIANAKSAKLCRGLQNLFLFGSSSIGFVTSANQFVESLPAFVSRISPWGSVLTTMAGAMGAHLMGNKFDDISLEYEEAAQELEDMMDEDWTKGDWREKALDTERIIASTVTQISGTYLGIKHDKSAETTAEGRIEEEIKGNEPKWDPDVICGDDYSGFYPASDRVVWLKENQGMSDEDAKQKVMKEYPKMFMFDYDG